MKQIDQLVNFTFQNFAYSKLVVYQIFTLRNQTYHDTNIRVLTDESGTYEARMSVQVDNAMCSFTEKKYSYEQQIDYKKFLSATHNSLLWWKSW